METGLEGQVMARIMEELLGTKGKLSPNAGQASNGQEWYDSLKNDVPEILKGYIAQEKNLLYSRNILLLCNSMPRIVAK